MLCHHQEVLMSNMRTIAAVALLLVLASSSYAIDLTGFPKTATATPIPPQGHGQLVRQLAAPNPAGIPVYDCPVLSGSFLATNTLSPIDNLPYIEYGEDCHLANSGALTGFSMAYFKPGTSLVSALITFYDNDAGDTILGLVVAGPYLVTNMPAGLNSVIITPPDSPLLPPNVWYAVQFSPANAGLVIADGPPTVGSSHDVFVDTGLTTPPAGLVFFGGAPVANFVIGIEADVTVPVTATTWGHMKAMYSSHLR